MKCVLLISTVLLAINYAEGFATYSALLPNGNTVPNPCRPRIAGAVWRASGHNAFLGGGPRNPFGNAFVANGRTWTRALCLADSDGDGRSNGAELGDPTCRWRAGAVPQGRATGHPGICEPIGSRRCITPVSPCI